MEILGNKEVSDAKKERLASREGLDSLRTMLKEGGFSPKGFPCPFCGHPLDTYSVQCDGCGVIYFLNEVRALADAHRLRQKGKSEQEIAEFIQAIHGWQFSTVKKTSQNELGFKTHWTPLMETLAAPVPSRAD